MENEAKRNAQQDNIKLEQELNRKTLEENRKNELKRAEKQLELDLAESDNKILISRLNKLIEVFGKEKTFELEKCKMIAQTFVSALILSTAFAQRNNGNFASQNSFIEPKQIQDFLKSLDNPSQTNIESLDENK